MPRRDTTTDTQRYKALTRTVTTVGLLRRGSLGRRFMSCGKPNCRCHATPPQLHGPYYLNRTGFLGDLIAWEDGVYGTSKSVFSGGA